MEERIKLSPLFITGTLVMIAIGLAAFITAFLQQPDRGWANFLLNNFYFLSLAVGAAFFLAIQRVTHSGWSAGFIRVPEAMAGYIPVAAIFFLVLILGAPLIYQWAHPQVVESDELLLHKSPFLNLPFWVVRMVGYFLLWILLTRVLRRLSIREDREGGMDLFRKSEYYSKVLIFVLAITFSLAIIDWVMSIDAHWYSTIFAAKDFISAFHHASIVIAFIVLLLNQRGYFPFLNKSHLHDFSRYIFILCIIWGYLWFAQFMLIWYGNLPEETSYFIPRIRHEGWNFFFYANIFINWFVPFALLMPKATSQSKIFLKIVIPILIIGQYIDLYLQIFPGTVGKQVLGFQEIGSFVGYAGLFMLVTGFALSRASLYPQSHPYLEESLQHHI